MTVPLEAGSSRVSAETRGPPVIMPYPGFRTLTITLTIVGIVTHPSCGFTIHRTTTADESPGPTTDLALQESVQVKYVKRPNDIRQGKDGDTIKETKNKHKFASEMKTDSTEDPTLVDSGETESTLDTTITDKTTQDFMTTESELEVTGTYSVSETSTTQEQKPTATTKKTSLTRTVASESAVSKSLSESLDKLTQNSKVTKTNIKQLTETEQLKTKLESTASTAIQNRNESKEKSTIGVSVANDQIAIDSEPNENLLAQKEPISNTITATVRDIENSEGDALTSSQIALSASSKITEKLITSSEETSRSSFEGNFTTSKSLKLDSSALPNDVSESASTVDEIIVTEDLNPTTTAPTWKKYTIIERKRVENSKELSSTEQENDSVKAESKITTLPIHSLETLKEDLIANSNHLSTVRELQTVTESIATTESIGSTQSETLGIVATKRAGFLDLSKRTSASYEETSTEGSTSYRTMYEVEAFNIETQEIKKTNGYESQSQLAEDAIKEELLKEEIINNHEENAKRHDEIGFFDVNKNKTEDSTTSQTMAEDTLRVQPINQDRRTTLYTVGPNYKPMKRIEVQPAKLFVRDPDDNSWRNESISSLGIVFKPKNSSSKSFKEVLKTKTETELNSLPEREDKGDTPELRERLEKIAEVRKSKKKRINKLGEVVYTDYEEGGSAEVNTTPKAETTQTEHHSSESSSTLTSKNSETESTSPMTTTEHQRYWKTQLETISKEEMIKDVGMDVLTTQKPKKPYNLAEYYDTTDEYDADYFTLPKVDLKKFTVPFKATFPSLTSPPTPPPSTSVIRPRFPERKPTVQYFPPTTKPQKVNVNDYDVNFERRVQLYTLKETPKTMPPFDIANEPVATDQPDIRHAVKPTDFNMYTARSPDTLNKHVYMTSEPRDTEPQNYVINDGNFNRGTYIIKHYRDFLNDAAKEEDDHKPSEFLQYTEAPVRGVTLDELASATDRGKTTEADYEYESQFRKDVLGRFVDNFNQNSDRYKVDFPVLFNTSVVHRTNDDHGVLASSSTFVKRLYGSEPMATQAPLASSNLMKVSAGCEPNCDNITVELSPAYELHYYVPEQEEKEVVVPQPAAGVGPYNNRYTL